LQFSLRNGWRKEENKVVVVLVLYYLIVICLLVKEMNDYQVSKAVGKVQNQGPELVEELK
jgi:hypothetical protein